MIDFVRPTDEVHQPKGNNHVIPGLIEFQQERLASLLHRRITDLTPDWFASLPFQMMMTGDPELEAIGVHTSGAAKMTVVVTDPGRPIGRIEVVAQSPGCLLLLDNRAAEGHLAGSIRMLGPDNTVLFPSLGGGTISVHTVLLRSARQMLFWGAGATAVGCSIELEGSERVAAIGDDALISSGVWIRNHDMHAVVDLRTKQTVNKPPADTIVERHVWIGQNALLLNCTRVGAGAIIGAQSLVKREVGECIAVGGVPARMLRAGVSWGRDTAGMTDAERASLQNLPPAR